MNETIGIRTPDGQVTTLRIPVKYTEDDLEIAVKLAAQFPRGTVLSVDGNKFQVVSRDPPEVSQLRKKPTEDPEPISERKPSNGSVQAGVQIGQRWVTKDSRRKQDPFEVASVHDDHILTDKGAKIQLKRLSRYRLVS